MQNYKIQRSPEWHEFRRAHLGASEASIVMGVNPWKDVKQLYIEKVNCNSPSNTENYAMRRGIELEPVALALFEAETGYLMMPRVLVHPTINFMSASLDGMELDGKCIVEIKCPGKADHELALKGIVPEKYIPQLQHQMEVCGLDSMYYMSYVSDTDYKIFEVRKDHEYSRQLVEKEYQFWDRVQRKDPPPRSDKDIHEIKDPNWSFYADKWRMLQDEKRDLEKRETEIRENFIQLADSSPAQGFGLKLTKVIRQGAVEYSRIPVLEGIDLEPYRKKSTESWRIVLKESNDEN